MRELRPDEKRICNWLSQYEALPKEQVIRLLHDKPRGTAEKIIRGLNKEHRLAYLSQGYYVGVDSQCKADWKTVSAMWVLLHFIEKVEPEHHRKGNYPAQIFFLKEGIGYEILVISQGDEYVTKLLQPQGNQKYIIIVPDLETAKQLWLPAAPCLFAILHMEEGEDIPVIKFYTPEGIRNGR